MSAVAVPLWDNPTWHSVRAPFPRCGFGAWQMGLEAVQRIRQDIAELRANARPVEPDDAPRCAVCGDCWQIDCSGCGGQGCRDCEQTGMVGCECAGGPDEVDDED